MTIERDEFDIWLANPITKAFFAKLKYEMERTRQHWVHVAWDKGVLSEKEYAYHRARFDALSQIVDLAYEDIFEEAETDDQKAMERDRSNG